MNYNQINKTLEKKGYEIAIPTIKRYASLGLLPKPEKTHGGRGVGYVVDYPETVIGDVFAINKMIQIYRLNSKDIKKIREKFLEEENKDLCFSLLIKLLSQKRANDLDRWAIVYLSLWFQAIKSKEYIGGRFINYYYDTNKKMEGKIINIGKEVIIGFNSILEKEKESKEKLVLGSEIPKGIKEISIKRDLGSDRGVVEVLVTDIFFPEFGPELKFRFIEWD